MSSTLEQILANVQASSSIADPKALEVKSWAFFFVGVGSAMACLGVFHWLQQQIHNTVVADGFQGNLEELTIFDVRFGYPLETVIHVLNEWGRQGRLLYLLVQTVDVFVYHAAYRAASLVWLIRLVLLYNITSYTIYNKPSQCQCRYCSIV